MKIVSFIEGQGSAEWLEWRRNGIGASDIGIIMKTSPYKSPLQLWEVKCGYAFEDSSNWAIDHGKKYEEVARQWLCSNLQLNLRPFCVEDDKKSHYRASLDAYDPDQKTLIEIKCPVSTDILDRARTEHFIPQHWLDQLTWQMMLVNPIRASLAMWDYRHNSCIVLDVFACTDRIKEMQREADAFWRGVQMGKAPEAEKSDYIEVEDEKLQELLLEYQMLSEKEKALSDRKKEIKKQVEAFGDDGNFMAYGFKIQRVQPAPKYDIEQMQLDGIDVEHYRKISKNIGWYRIIPPSKKKA